VFCFQSRTTADTCWWAVTLPYALLISNHWFNWNILTTIYTYIYLQRNRILEKLIDAHLVKIFPEFCGTRRCITMLTRSLSWERWIQTTSSLPLGVILVLSFNLNLHLLYPSGVSTIDHCGSRCKGRKSPPLIHTYIHTSYKIQNLYAFLFSPMRATGPIHLNILFYLYKNI
jgi:hypothetical protein